MPIWYTASIHQLKENCNVLLIYVCVLRNCPSHSCFCHTCYVSDAFKHSSRGVPPAHEKNTSGVSCCCNKNDDRTTTNNAMFLATIYYDY